MPNCASSTWPNVSTATPWKPRPPPRRCAPSIRPRPGDAPGLSVLLPGAAGKLEGAGRGRPAGSAPRAAQGMGLRGRLLHLHRGDRLPPDHRLRPGRGAGAGRPDRIDRTVLDTATPQPPHITADVGTEASYLWRDPRSIGDVLVGAAPSLEAGHGGLSRGHGGAPAAQRGRTTLTPARVVAGSSNDGAAWVTPWASPCQAWSAGRGSPRAGVQPYLGARTGVRRHDG